MYFFSLEIRTNTIKEANNCTRYDFPFVINKELKGYNFILGTLVVFIFFFSKGIFLRIVVYTFTLLLTDFILEQNHGITILIMNMALTFGAIY